MYKHGFTLIEMLVVSLVIGILAAIALPQYEIAVGKSRTIDAIANLRAITEAQEAYFLATGEYTNDISVLDADVKPAGKFYTYSCLWNRTCSASPRITNLPNLEFHMQMNPTGTAAAHLGKHWCMARPDNEIQKAICANWGPLDPAMTTTSWYYHIMQ